jgi:hypothetical protein
MEMNRDSRYCALLAQALSSFTQDAVGICKCNLTLVDQLEPDNHDRRSPRSTVHAPRHGHRVPHTHHEAGGLDPNGARGSSV